MSHYNQLIEAFKYEWANRPANPLLDHCTIINDTPRNWWVDDRTGQQIIQWECRRFPGCDTLIITTKVELRDDLRGRGLGRYFRELRHRAYKRAGFVGELATVRTDNAAQNRLMVGSVPMGEFRSDFGGTFKLWLTNLVTPTAARRENPSRVAVAVQSRVHEGDLTRHLLHTDLDAIAMTPPTVQPLPGDGVGLLRNESDESLRARIRVAAEEASAADGFILPSEAELELCRREKERQRAAPPLPLPTLTDNARQRAERANEAYKKFASPIRPPITVYSHWPKQ